MKTIWAHSTKVINIWFMFMYTHTHTSARVDVCEGVTTTSLNQSAAAMGTASATRSVTVRPLHFWARYSVNRGIWSSSSTNLWGWGVWGVNTLTAAAYLIYTERSWYCLLVSPSPSPDPLGVLSWNLVMWLWSTRTIMSISSIRSLWNLLSFIQDIYATT